MELLETCQTKGWSRWTPTAGLERRMAFLNPADRKLLEIESSGSLMWRQLAALLGRDVGSVTRRIGTLRRRLNDPLVIALVEEGKLLPEFHREVGLAYFLRREPVARIAREMGLSKYETRRIVMYVRGWGGVGGKRET
ncbi:MAG TPA: hypothetical protein VH475_26950 [Tepidisphaeraceae bacterium]